MTLAQLCLLAALNSPMAASFDGPAIVSSAVSSSAMTVVAPQGPNRPTPGRRNPPPSGGTPEPMTMLLLAGGALTYGALRLRGRKNVVKES